MHDWYNAVVDSLNECDRSDYGVILDYRNPWQSSFLRWYEYKMTVPAKGRIVNTVSAPMYPSINARYSSPVYTYNYLLSPAKSWAEFGTLDIEILTPYSMVLTERDFIKTETGYSLSLSGLPSGELTFSLSAQEKLDRYGDIGCISAGKYVGITLLFGITFICIVLLKRQKTK